MSAKNDPKEKQNVVNLELYADEQNSVLICKFPDTYAITRSTTVGNGNRYASSGDTVIRGNENAISVKLTPQITSDVYSNRALLNFCKKNIDSNIEDVVLLTDNGMKEFLKLGKTGKDIALGIILCPCLFLLAMVATASGDTHMLDSCRPNLWRWTNKKMAASRTDGTFIDYKFNLVRGDT
jgi:hypothetical protein